MLAFLASVSEELLASHSDRCAATARHVLTAGYRQDSLEGRGNIVGQFAVDIAANSWSFSLRSPTSRPITTTTSVTLPPLNPFKS
jgi:hypothetical protein